MAHLQRASNRAASSSHINYRGETKVNVTEHEYTWIIKDFAKSSLTNRACIASPVFISLHDNIEYPWTMRLYPGGCIDHPEHPSVQLRAHEFKDLKKYYKKLTLTINLLNIHRKPVDLGFVEHMDFQSRSPYILTRDNLSSYLVNGKLTLLIKICFEDKDDISCPTVNDESSISISDPNNRLLEFDDFENLLESGKFSDVTLIAGDEKFHVHKGILSARSPVFSAMFEHDMKENHENEIEIPDIEPTVMKEMLRFIYAGKVQSIEKINSHLFLAANKYGLSRLKDACEISLIDEINVDNICDILTIVNLCVPTKLFNAVLEVMKFNSKILKNNEKLSKMISKLSPDLIAKVLDALMSEM